MIALLLAGVLLAWLLQKQIFRHFWAKNLEIRTEFADANVCEGDFSTLREEITNDKRMPLPALEVRLVLSRNLEFSGEAAENSNITDQSYRRDVFSLFSRQKVIRRLSFRCERRGFYSISRVEAVASDFFYQGGYYMEVPQTSSFYVYPRFVSTERIRLLCQAVSGELLVQNRLYPDPFEFAGIREYRPTDPMNHINWKASARGGELMVNQYDSTTSVQVRILLDVWDTGVLKYEDLTEEGIRIAASLAAKLAAQNMETELITNGYLADVDKKTSQADSAKPFKENAAPSVKPSKKAAAVNFSEMNSASHKVSDSDPESGSNSFSIHLKPGAARIQELLRGLACLDTSLGTENAWELLNHAAETGRTGEIHVFISHDQSERTFQAARAFAAAGNSLLWVLPVSSLAGRSLPEIPGVKVLEWEAEN